MILVWKVGGNSNCFPAGRTLWFIVIFIIIHILIVLKYKLSNIPSQGNREAFDLIVDEL